MTSIYDELAEELRGKIERIGSGERSQFWVGIAGGPGSGKSTLSEAVVSRLGKDVAVVLPMDGFHYSRAQLRAMADEPGSAHSFEDLLARRGSPWTFDAAGLVSSLTAAKQQGSAVLPTYSRQLSDPVPGGVTLLASHRIVLCEGNYLLNWDDAAWSGLSNGLFDETWYISCPDMEQQRQRLIKRHLETWTDEKSRLWGAGEAGAAKKADSNDVVNAQLIEATSKKHADRVIVSR